MSRTDLVMLVVDASGSMANVHDAAMRGLNGLLDEQASVSGRRAVVGALLFDDGARRMLPAIVPIDEFPRFTRANYALGGRTALFDAICRAETEARAEVARRARSASPVDQVYFVIQTDGAENASREFTLSDVRARLRAAEADGWHVVYLGANQDAMRAAQHIGLAAQAGLSYHTVPGNGSDRDTTAAAYAGLSAVISASRRDASHRLAITDDVRAVASPGTHLRSAPGGASR